VPLHARSIKKPLKGEKKVHCKGVQYHHSLPFCFPFPCLFFISKENKCVICLLKLWYFFWSGMCFLQNTPEKWNSVLSLKEYYKTWRFRSLCSKVKYSAWQITDLELTTLDLLNLSNWTLWNCIEKPNQIWLAYICVLLPSFLGSVLHAHVYFEIVFISLFTASQAVSKLAAVRLNKCAGHIFQNSAKITPFVLLQRLDSLPNFPVCRPILQSLWQNCSYGHLSNPNDIISLAEHDVVMYSLMRFPCIVHISAFSAVHWMCSHGFCQPSSRNICPLNDF